MTSALRRQSHDSLLALVILLGFSTQGNAGLIIAGTQTQHIAMGADLKFQANGWLAGFDQQDQFNIAGNFVLISPTLGLTVAHVADGLANPWKSMYASFSRNIYNDPPNYIQVAYWELYPGFVDDNGAGGSDDIALLHFAQPIASVMPAEIYWGDLSPGMTIEFAGIGYQNEWWNDAMPPTFTGELWGGDAVITDVGVPPLGIEENYFRTKFLSSTSQTRMAPLQSYSGSGAFWDGKLVGLAAAASGNGLGSSADISLFIRPSSYEAFISVPEPSTLALAGTAAAALAVMAIRRRCVR